MSNSENIRSSQRTCPWWLAYTFETPLRKLQTPVSKVLLPYLKEGMRFGDYGCGQGFFSLNAAKIVGDNGRVFAYDIQQKMLDITMTRAERQGLDSRITPVRADADSLNIIGTVDYALSCWVAHEVGDIEHYLKQIFDSLATDGYYMLMEPMFHVSKKTMLAEVEAAKSVGFTYEGQKDVGFGSKGFLFKKNQG